MTSNEFKLFSQTRFLMRKHTHLVCGTTYLDWLWYYIKRWI